MSLTANEIEQIKRIVVDPVIQDNQQVAQILQSRFDEIVRIFKDHEKQDQMMMGNHDDRIRKLEQNQLHARVVYGIMVGGLTIAFNLCIDRIKKWMGW